MLVVLTARASSSEPLRVVLRADGSALTVRFRRGGATDRERRIAWREVERVAIDGRRVILHGAEPLALPAPRDPVAREWLADHLDSLRANAR